MPQDIFLFNDTIKNILFGIDEKKIVINGDIVQY